MVKLAKRIREARETHGMSREAFARMVPCSSATIEDIENGTTTKPRPTMEAAIESVLESLTAAPSHTNGAANDSSQSVIHDQQPTPANHGESQAARSRRDAHEPR